jgi:hypothetical protein
MSAVIRNLSTPHSFSLSGWRPVNSASPANTKPSPCACERAAGKPKKAGKGNGRSQTDERRQKRLADTGGTAEVKQLWLLANKHLQRGRNR